MTTALLLLFPLALFETLIKPSLRLRVATRKPFRTLWAVVLCSCVLFCAGPVSYLNSGDPPGLHSEWSQGELLPSEVGIYGSAASSAALPLSTSTGLPSTRQNPGETSSAALMVHPLPAMHTPVISTQAVMVSSFPAAADVSLVTVAVWQLPPDIVSHYVVIRAYLSTARVPIPGTQQLPTSGHKMYASGAILLRSPDALAVCSCTFLTAGHPMIQCPPRSTSSQIKTSTDATVPIHCNDTGLPSILMVFVTSSLETADLSAPIPLPSTTLSAATPSDVWRMSSLCSAAINALHHSALLPATSLIAPLPHGGAHAVQYMATQTVAAIWFSGEVNCIRHVFPRLPNVVAAR